MAAIDWLTAHSFVAVTRQTDNRTSDQQVYQPSLAESNHTITQDEKLQRFQQAQHVAKLNPPSHDIR